MSAVAKVIYTARTPGGELAQFEEPCATRTEAAEYAARIRSLQEARELPVDARVEPVPVKASSFVSVEFRVIYTAVEGAGGYPAENLDDAATFCERVLAWQEQFRLPEDAHIVCRVAGGEWQRWARLAEKAGAATA